MGKKAGDKGREWEKERRDKLNAGFLELCKLLPDHDPSISMSKMEILKKATEFIKHLQEKNEEIMKCGKDSFLKSETERLKKRVAYLVLKTTELVDALRQAGVPIPSKSKKKNVKGKNNKEGTQSLNQQNSDPSTLKKLDVGCKGGKLLGKKKVKCGCEKKLKLNKKPLTEINPSVSAVVTAVSSVVTACLSEPVNKVCSEVISQSAENQEKCNSLLEKTVPQISTQSTETETFVSQNNTRNIVTQSVVQPLIQTNVSLIKPTQTLNVDKKELSKLGPGTLIFADGRIVNVPPVLPQIVVKPPPPAPPPAVILMQTPEIALPKQIVKIASHDERKEKFIVPKKREITMTTFVNKLPIPAVKAFRLEPCAREPRTKKKANKDQKKSQPVESTSVASPTVTTVSSLTSSSSDVIISTDSSLLKRKNQEEPKTSGKTLKSNAKESSGNFQTENTLVNQSGIDGKSQAVKCSVDGLHNKQNEVECVDISPNIPITISEQENHDVELNSEVTVSNITSPTNSESSTTQVVNSNGKDTSVIATNETTVNSDIVEQLTSTATADVDTLPASSVESSFAADPITSENTLEKTTNSSSEQLSVPVGSPSINSPVLSNVSYSSSSTTRTGEPLPSTSQELISVEGMGCSEIVKSKRDGSSGTIMNEISTVDETPKLLSVPVANESDNFMSSSDSSKNSSELLTATLTYSGVTTCTNVFTNISCSNTTTIASSEEVCSPMVSDTTTVSNTAVPQCSERLTTVADDAVTTKAQVSKLSVTGKDVNTASNKSKSQVSSNNEFMSSGMSPVSSALCAVHDAAVTKSSLNKSKMVDLHVVPDTFTNVTSKASETSTNFNAVSYNNIPALPPKTTSSYSMSDVFVNTNPISQTSSATNLSDRLVSSSNVGNSIPVSMKSSATFRMPAVSVSNANSLSKAYGSYSVSDAFVTNIHLTHRSSSTFNISDADSCCIPPDVSKHTSACCMNPPYSANTSLTKTSTSFTKSDLFPAISSISYKSSGNYGTADTLLNNTTIKSKSTTVFSMTDMFTPSVTATTKASTFGMSDVYTTYSTPLCSSKTSSTFTVSGVFTTNSSTLSKTSHTFTMADLYTPNPIPSKPSHPFTMNDITSNTLNSSVTFTVGNNSTDRINKSCEQITAPLSTTSEQNPLYETHHKLPTVPVSSTSRTHFTNEKDKTYSVSTMGNNYKSDQCSEILRTTKDIDRGFMPVMEDVRLTSDFSNDLFSSLQVPTGNHHSESISPTAAFLLAFPLVSTSKNTENLADTENNENHTSTPTTILQIGNIEPPSTELFHSMDFGKSKDFEVQTDLDCKSKQKTKHKNPATINQSYSCYPFLPNDYAHQCDFTWSSKSVEKKKQERVQKYQYDCYKQDKKKRKISVNWMTTPENDMYKETEFPSSSGHYNFEMETFPDICNNKKNHGNYSWSPSKSLLPLDNPLMIPSTLPTLVGDLALGTTTPSDPFKRCEKKDKQDEKKFAQPKSQAANFLSVSQLVDPKCKKQKPSAERPYTKQKQLTSSVSNDKKRQCMGPSNHHNREYQTTSKRKEPNEPCMYPDNFVPHFNWDNKHRYKGGSYSAESLIQQDACDTFNFNYQQNNFFQNSEFGHDNGQSGCGQYQNFLNFPQGHFSSCVTEEYPTENFTLTSQSNNRMGPPTVGQSSLSSSNDKQRNMGQPLREPPQVRDEGSSYHCGNNSTATFHHYPHHHHQQHPQQQHSTGYPSTNLQHNFSSVGGSGGSGPPPPPPPPLPPPVSNYSVSTTSTLANFNLSTIFPEINDQRIGTASLAPPRNHLNTFSNNQSYRSHVSMH